jgi:hypothetical protein
VPEVKEERVYDALLRYKGKGKTQIADTEIGLSLNPIDIHGADSPDCVLWIDISLRIFGQDLKLRVPIPVEAEKGGIFGGALEDLRKFVEREKYPIELPMLVIAEAGYNAKQERVSFPVRVAISQIPVRLLNE